MDAVSACARDPDDAFKWIHHVEVDGSTFDELGLVSPEWRSLDAKIRMAMSKHTTGKEGDAHKELTSALLKKRDELKRSSDPRCITGRQMLWTVRDFYRINDNVETTFELGTVMHLTYPGDAQLGKFKDTVDKLFRSIQTKLTDKDKAGIMIGFMKQSIGLKLR